MTDLALRPSPSAPPATDEQPKPLTAPARPPRAGASSSPRESLFDHSIFADPASERRHRLRVGLLLAAALLVSIGLLAWDNPLPVGTEGFWRIARLRAHALIAILLVGWCQGLATIAFQTIAGNRILTPSIMGFESLYRLIQTSVVFLFGAAGLAWIPAPLEYLVQAGLMVGFAALLFGSLLFTGRTDLHRTLLIGIVIGTGLGAGAAYLQRLLTPTEFDLLSARLIGNISNADPTSLLLAAPLALAAGIWLIKMSPNLDVLTLGPHIATGLGIEVRSVRMRALLLIAVLMAVSTSLVGPMSFLGFLIALATYEISGTHAHSRILPLGAIIGVVLLGGSYFILRHVFYAQGSVGVIIEAVGGTAFILHILRKGRL